MQLLSLIPTHTVAKWLLRNIDALLGHLGLGYNQQAEEVVYIIIIIAFSLLLGLGVKKCILILTQKAVRLRNTEVGRELLEQHTLTRCSHIIPPLVFMALIPFAFAAPSATQTWIMRIGGVYSLFAFAVAVNAVLTFIFNHYNAHENTKNLPLKGILNVAKGIVWIVILIIAISIIVNKSPGTLLAGLGAFAAALMLIFKDSILGFVAGIQMSENDMLHVGDWIVVPSTPANGIVLDVSLSTVKVRNWDMTIVMVPPYTLVSTSFQNYRGMWDAGVRRIDNALIVDITTIRPADDEMLQNVGAKFPEIKPFIDNLKAKGELVVSDPGDRPVNGTIETNLGLFRAYIGQYLTNHPHIAKDQQILVRLLQATTAGVPLQVYCFTDTTNWDAYEGIQSEIMEHLAAVISHFGGLGIYSSSSLTIESSHSDAPQSNPAPNK